MPNTSTYIDSPANLDAKGRNGYFKLRTLRVCAYWSHGRQGANVPVLRIELNSQRPADTPPACIEGPAAEVLQLIALLGIAAEEAIAAVGDTDPNDRTLPAQAPAGAAADVA